MHCTRSESTEIPLCEPLDEPDLMIGTILVNGHRTVLSTYVHTCGLGMVRNGTRKQYVPICLRSIATIVAAPSSEAHLWLFGGKKSCRTKIFQRPHHNHLTSINAEIDRRDDGSVPIAPRILGNQRSKIRWGLLPP